MIPLLSRKRKTSPVLKITLVAELGRRLRFLAQKRRIPADKLLFIIISQSLEDFEHLERQLERCRQLTPRERQVAQLCAAGCTNPQIARQLELCLNTVKIHLQNIFHKLRINSREQISRVFQHAEIVALLAEKS